MSALLRHSLLSMLGLLILNGAIAGTARATSTPISSLYVIVSSESPIHSISQRELIALYTGRTRAFSSGELAQPLDQRKDSSAREAFYLALTGMDLARINSYWARLHFTGQIQPPDAVGDDEAVLQKVRRSPSAIGYLTQQPMDPSVRVLLTLP